MSAIRVSRKSVSTYRPSTRRGRVTSAAMPAAQVPAVRPTPTASHARGSRRPRTKNARRSTMATTAPASASQAGQAEML
jgi:hypothetical protein